MFNKAKQGLNFDIKGSNFGKHALQKRFFRFFGGFSFGNKRFVGDAFLENRYVKSISQIPIINPFVRKRKKRLLIFELALEAGVEKLTKKRLLIKSSL